MHTRRQKFGCFLFRVRSFADFKVERSRYNKNNRSGRWEDCRKALGVELLRLRKLEALGINEKVNKFDFARGGLAASQPVQKKSKLPLQQVIKFKWRGGWWGGITTIPVKKPFRAPKRRDKVTRTHFPNGLKWRLFIPSWGKGERRIESLKCQGDKKRRLKGASPVTRTP